MGTVANWVVIGLNEMSARAKQGQLLSTSSKLKGSPGTYDDGDSERVYIAFDLQTDCLTNRLTVFFLA